MPTYRLYHLDPYTGHINKAEDLFAADDVAAIHDVQLRHLEHPVELWDRSRKVVHFDANPDLPPPGRARRERT